MKKKLSIVLCIVLTLAIIPMATMTAFGAVKTPNKVVIKSAKASSSEKIKLTWKKVKKNCNMYEVARSKQKSSGFKVVAETKSTSFTDEGLSPNTTYYYKVRAINKQTVKQWQGYNETKQEWFDIPSLDSWVGGNYQPRQIDKEVIKKGKYSKTVSAKTSKKKLTSKYYDCVVLNDKAYFCDCYIDSFLYQVDIKTGETQKYNLSAYKKSPENYGMAPDVMYIDGDVIYIRMGGQSTWFELISFDTMNNRISVPLCSMREYGRPLYIKDSVVYFSSSNKTRIYDIKTAKMTSSKSYTVSETTTKNGSNSKSYYVKRSNSDSTYKLYLCTPDKKILISSRHFDC